MMQNGQYSEVYHPPEVGLHRARPELEFCHLQQSFSPLCFLGVSHVFVGGKTQTDCEGKGTHFTKYTLGSLSST